MPVDHTTTLTARRAYARRLLVRLRQLFPEAAAHPHTELTYADPWQLLVAVMLSAQCTDKKVNEVTPALFARYPRVEDYARISQDALERMIHSTGFYKTKAKHIRAAARMLIAQYGGVVPKSMEEMIRLPGVGRKTANVVLGNAYGIASGIAVDTHVRRLSRRFGLTTENDPVKIERDLMTLYPEEVWMTLAYCLIAYGRRHCTARSCPADHPLSAFDRGV